MWQNCLWAFFSEGVNFEVAQISPEPLQRSIMKIPKPDWTQDQLENPDREDYIKEFVALQLTEETKTHSGKYYHTNHRMHDVIGQGHFANRSQTAFQPNQKI